MKKMKTKLYRCLLVCFMLCLGMGAFCVHANAEKKTGFTVKVKSGLDGKVQANTPFQVSITATSDKNFKGSVRVTPAAYEDYYSVVSASTDITLAAGESKTVNVTCAGMENSYYRVELLNEAGEVVHTQKEKLEILIEDKMLVGILSDDEGAISYIDNTLVKENEQEKYIGIVSLEADSFPVESCNLLSLSVIVVDNYDMSKLSDKQMDSLEKWIRKGGKLILSLGANYQNVLQGCDQRFGIETNGEVTNENFVSESEIEYP